MSISRYLKVSQGKGAGELEIESLGISRYLKARNGSKGAGELEIEYLKVSLEGISRYLPARNGSKGAGELEIEYLKVSHKVSQGSEWLKRSWGARN